MTNDIKKLDLYISTEGNDDNDGSFASPLATITQAKKHSRTLDYDVNIFLRGGEYFVDETIIFSLNDSGNDNKRITYQNYMDEKPVLTSGACVKNWQKLAGEVEGLPNCALDNVWIADIPEGIDDVKTLYDGYKRLERTYSEFFMPEKTFEYDRLDSLSIANKADWKLLKRVDCPKGKLRNWDNIEDIELKVMPVPWTVDTLPIERVDLEENVAWLKVPMTAPMSAKPRGIRIENAIDHLNCAGKWCVNTKTRKIYYWPSDAQPSENMQIPTLKEFIRVEGQINYDKEHDMPCSNIHFKGLTFKHGMRDTTAADYKGLSIQHDWEMFDKNTAIIRFRGVENCSISNCYFHATSGSAIRLDLHCQHIIIENNMLDDIGSMGILLCGYGPGTKDVNHHNTIRNNIITRCGQVIWHGHGIFLWQSGNNIIENNRIHHSARKAIGVCGVRVTILKNPHIDYDEASRTIRWDEINKTIDNQMPVFERFLPYLHSKDNIIRNNEIFRVLEKIEDGSALNISGAGGGNMVYQNYIHHIKTHRASGAMRVDDWQNGTTFSRNIIYKCNLSAIVRKNHNHIINNIFADVNAVKGYLRFASYPDEIASYGSDIKNNIFYESLNDVLYYGEGYLVSDGATYPRHCNKENNIFYCKGNSKYAKKHLEIHDENGSICADPLFKDIQNEDFDLLPDSPALAMGFVPIDMQIIGINKDYPAHLLELEYTEIEDESAYDRGRDDTKTNYEWW